MKKDIKNFVEQNKDKVVFAVTYDKNKRAGRKFDCMVEETINAEDIDELTRILSSAINVLEALKQGIP